MNYFSQKSEGDIQPQESEVPDNVDSNLVSTDNDKTSNLNEQTFTISEYRNCFDNEPKPCLLTWKSFCEEFSKHSIREQKDGPAWSPVSFFEGGTRKNTNVDQIFMAVIDVDNGTPHETVLERLSGYACLVHSSYTHSPELQKYRIILPLAKPAKPDEWRQDWSRINQMVGGCNDASTKDPARLYYKPAHPIGTSHHFVKIQGGIPISVDGLPAVEEPVQEQPIKFFRNNGGQRFQEIDGIESNGPELNYEQGLTEVVNRCAFMQYASASENQPTLPEPLWMAMISNACRFENSEKWIHDASKLHAEYDEGATDAKIEHVLNGSAPITCNQIRALGFKGCPGRGCSKPNGEATKAPAGLMGWMFRRQLTLAETASNQLPEEYSIDSFDINPAGVFQRKTSEKGITTTTRLSSRIDVVSLTRDPESDNWGIELRFADPDGVVHSWAMPRELPVSSGDFYRSSLMRMGATIAPGNKAREGLAEYLVAAMPEARALSVKQPGWFNGVFVLPNGIYGRSNERVVFQTSDPDEIKRFSQRGTLESWQQHIAGPCQGNSRAVISICIGLAPPLLALLGEDNGGFHLRGPSSIGKSVCLYLGSSVWGGNSLIRTWNMTVNGLEGVATMHNDILLPLDELGQVEAKDAGEAAYMLGNGQGKGRATKDGDARKSKRWRNLVLSSGEKSMSDLMAAAGQLVMAGQEVRMVEIAADAGRSYGVFEDIHGGRSSQVFAESLKQAIAEHHGHAGRAFVEILANPDLQPKLVGRAKAWIQHFVDTYVPEGATGQVGRVARRFGLVAAAGEICIELGILPWPEGEAIAACRKCFQSWIELRGGIGNHEAEQAIAQVRRFIEVHGESRFTAWIDGIDNNGYGKTIQRAGFRRITPEGRTEFYILPEAYKTEVCAGLNATYVTKTLVEHGFLATNNQGKAQADVRLPGLGKKKVYHLKADFMGEDVSQPEKEEADGRQPRVFASPIKYIV